MQSRLIFPFFLIICLTATWFIYEQGVTGSLFYDDRSNLDSLKDIKTYQDAWRFVFEGTAGPLGRPIAQASFLPHAKGWPKTSIDARRVNVIIHLTNGILIFILSYLILRLHYQNISLKSHWIALGGALLWMVMPILASTTLITVQRCTSLSALFGLAGLIAFVYGYFIQKEKPRLALIIQFFGLAAGTLLSIFTKESGALFPIYALIIDSVLLKEKKPPCQHQINIIRRIILYTALFVLLFYLSPANQNWFEKDQFRGWSSIERLTTEVVLLWKYLYMTFFPKPTVFGPFHDDVNIIQGWLIPAAAALGFFIITLLAFLIRHKTPWLLFALLWFFVGHLLESTVIHLELMFEHRNYLAIYGFCLLLSAIAFENKKYSRFAIILFWSYTIIVAFILYGTTSIWGQPLVAAENWARRHPQSARAVTHLADSYYLELGDISPVLPHLDQIAQKCLGCVDVKVQILLYACGHTSNFDIQKRIEDILNSAPNAKPSIALLDSMYPLQQLIYLNRCPPLSSLYARDLVLILLRNPNYSAWQYQVHLLFHAAYFSKELGDLDSAYKYLEEAEKISNKVLPILQMQVHLFVKQNRYDEALSAIERRQNIKGDRYMTKKVLDELKNVVYQAKSQFEMMGSQ